MLLEKKSAMLSCKHRWRRLVHCFAVLVKDCTSSPWTEDQGGGICCISWTSWSKAFKCSWFSIILLIIMLDLRKKNLYGCGEYMIQSCVFTFQVVSSAVEFCSRGRAHMKMKEKNQSCSTTLYYRTLLIMQYNLCFILGGGWEGGGVGSGWGIKVKKSQVYLQIG